MPDINGLRYPNTTDVPDVPSAIQSLATDTSRRLFRQVADISALNSISDMVIGDRIFLMSHGIHVRYSGPAKGWVNHVEEWIYPTLTAGWSPYDLATYGRVGYIKKRGVVFIRGTVKKDSGTGGSGEALFTLPVGYRPAKTKLVAAPSTTANASGYARIDIGSSGAVVVNGFFSASPQRLSLNFEYPAEA